jgi:hypothetical protein
MIRFLYAEGKIGWPESNNHGDTSLASRTLQFDRLAPVPRQFNVSRKPPLYAIGVQLRRGVS